MKIGVLTDSTCDIPEDLRKEYDIHIVPLYIIHQDKTFKDNELKWQDFSKMLMSDSLPTTSQPSINDFVQKYNEMLKEYDHIIGIFISSLLSGTYSAAVTASTMIEESQRISLIDTESGSCVMGLMAMEIAKKAKSGNISETVAFAESLTEKSEIYFIPSDVKYLKRSGRVSRAQSILINLMNVKLVLHTNRGKLELYKKAIGFKKGMQIIYNIIKSRNIRNNTVGISVTKDFERAEEIINKIKEMGYKTIVSNMGNVLTTHGGPNFFAVGFLNE